MGCLVVLRLETVRECSQGSAPFAVIYRVVKAHGTVIAFIGQVTHIELQLGSFAKVVLRH